DRPLRVDVEAEDRGKGTLAVACARARSVERGERAIRSPQEAMTHIAVVSVVSRDGACRVNATVAEGALRKRSCACTRSIKHSETAVSSAHVGVNHIGCLTVPSGDRPSRVLAVGAGALASASARARSVENSDGAVPGPYETVSREGRVTGKSRDFPRWRDIEGDGALVGACARARSIECGVDGEVELVECAANMDRMASGPERCQHQIDPGIDGEGRRAGGGAEYIVRRQGAELKQWRLHAIGAQILHGHAVNYGNQP